jgi:hypothetical protein
MNRLSAAINRCRRSESRMASAGYAQALLLLAGHQVVPAEHRDISLMVMPRFDGENGSNGDEARLACRSALRNQNQSREYIRRCRQTVVSPYVHPSVHRGGAPRLFNCSPRQGRWWRGDPRPDGDLLSPPPGVRGRDVRFQYRSRRERRRPAIRT